MKPKLTRLEHLIIIGTLFIAADIITDIIIWISSR